MGTSGAHGQADLVVPGTQPDGPRDRGLSHDRVPEARPADMRHVWRLRNRPAFPDAHVAGIPLPVFGLVGYTLLFVTACLPGQRARTAGMLFTVVAISASVVLTYIELDLIHAICIWCVASATCALCHVIVNSTRYIRGEPVLATTGPTVAAVNGAA